MVFRCSLKKLILIILKNSHRIFHKIHKLSHIRKSWHRCFPVNFFNFITIPLSIEQFLWLFLKIQDSVFKVDSLHYYKIIKDKAGHKFFLAFYHQFSHRLFSKNLWTVTCCNLIYANMLYKKCKTLFSLELLVQFFRHF